ncbi:alpha/beta hydrolase [Azospirillum sp. RWY-5-1]|uniref:Alpha/beta hydrolase n=1 Tax=Azospirillum oleiclasticum TaxID=2735135 RepID=A0ABX2TJC9_9PROT|nr:alpha/beta hydrolase [Azospirillum oleiclasticum]NYZ14440.1 alpha/beta hydrolase [Azospirillum oleiclasticum]NYZ23208.1 alpha/beta hydrolase [Azospirillum oleiclasticum]
MTPITHPAASPAFYPGFRRLDAEAAGVRFAGVVGGEGPPVLLLHGYPQTHIAWRKVAPDLARSHTLVIPDLPGYGGSRPDTMQPRWTKRRVAASLVALMQSLGHQRFAVVGHDRGARVGYRLVLDHPDAVVAFSSLTVVPTADALSGVDHRFSRKNFHWFFLAQDADLPERLLAAAPDAFIDRALASMAGGLERVEPAALDVYRAAFRDPAVRHAICEDYRAALTEDLALDTADRAAGRKLACPVQVLWPAAEERPDPVTVWSGWADDVTGMPTSGGHLQPEDAPDEVLAALRPFLGTHARGRAPA